MEVVKAPSLVWGRVQTTTVAASNNSYYKMVDVSNGLYNMNFERNQYFILLFTLSRHMYINTTNIYNITFFLKLHITFSSSHKDSHVHIAL